MKSARLFIRDDDVWTLDKNFRFFFDCAMERSLPVVYAVIPGKMDKGLVRFLRRVKQETPHLLDIVQHGWVHEDHASAGGMKHEFGTSRSYDEQREDITWGLRKMRRAFDGCFVPAFVPPYHAYDERTLEVIQEEGFQIFSAGVRRSKNKKRFMEIPAQVSFSRYDQGKTSIYKAKDVLGNIVRSMARWPLTGVLTHHADFTTASSRRELTQLFDFIAALRNKGEWQVLLFSHFERNGLYD